MNHSIKANLIVPMVGTGSRFRKAGYDTYKPFILIDDKPMIKHVMDAFPNDVTKYIIYSSDLVTEKELNYLKSQPNVVVCPVDAHKDGPVFSIVQAEKYLPLNESYFVSYCDIFWTWDYANDVQPFLNNDGIVFTRKKFHPHLVKDNFSAFCKPSNSDSTFLEKIQEKKSFTEDWMNEPLSVGVFYFKSGNEMISAFKKMITEDNRVAGEFFPSVSFNEFVSKNKNIKLIDVDFFIHWGLPAQLNDYNHWISFFKKLREPKTSQINTFGIKNICCMGGLGSRMKSLGNIPKALLKVESEPMFQFVSKNMIPNTPVTILTVNNVASEMGLLNNDFEVINLGEQTKSQYETLLRSRNYLSGCKNFLLSSCDALGIIDFVKLQKLIQAESPDAIIFTFIPSLLQNKLSSHHTFVSTKENKITAVHIKSKSSENDSGLAGLFWFKSGAVFNFLEQVPDDPKNEMCADHFLKYLVDSGKKVMAFPLDSYIHLGTLEEFKEFEFWSFFSKKLNPYKSV
jgi:NDP-sugar pyrophosphorylase family protein